MTNPLSSVVSLGRLPERVVEDLDAIAEAARQVPAIEQRVAHIELMLEDQSGRVVAIEKALGRLLAMAEKAAEHLPDPDDDRGAIAKARDAVTGD